MIKSDKIRRVPKPQACWETTPKLENTTSFPSLQALSPRLVRTFTFFNLVRTEITGVSGASDHSPKLSLAKIVGLGSELLTVSASGDSMLKR